MTFRRFAAFSVSGGILWVTLLSLAGYYFGKIPIVQKNFQIVVIAIVVISVLPAIVHALQARKRSRMRGFPVDSAKP